MKNTILPLIIYGVLYNWPAASSSCPAGWHLPSDAEWAELADFIKNDGYPGTEGTALKAANGWNCGTKGTDVYGFAALAGGVRSYGNGAFFDIGLYSNWWTSTTGNECCIAYRDLVCSHSVLGGSPGWAQIGRILYTLHKRLNKQLKPL
ncbi:MAG: FISUMP domain-containing protein [Draconibacterium sp.]